MLHEHNRGTCLLSVSQSLPQGNGQSFQILTRCRANKQDQPLQKVDKVVKSSYVHRRGLVDMSQGRFQMAKGSLAL